MATLLFLLVAALASIGHASLLSTGASVSLNNTPYFISPFPSGKVCDPAIRKQHAGQGDFVPVTVVVSQSPHSTLDELFSVWAATDDVWQPGFLGTVLLGGLNESTTARHQVFLNTTSEILPLQHGTQVPSGPYFLRPSTGTLHQAFRLYEDFAGAFTQSVLQAPDGKSFQPLSAQIPASAALTIGVPSRLYFTPRETLPLAGIRIGVKDIFSLTGLKRSNGNRAWYGLYPPANITASTIQSLVDAGAVVVGIQKTSQFANGEGPTADWVDYHAPFNPRGDGYQVTSSSSAGAGASIASYEWLDLAVGSDTGGSIRAPADLQGVFGNRPTRGLVGLENVMPLSPVLDTAGFLTRNPKVWDAASAVMYGSNYTSFAKTAPRYPTRLYAVDVDAGSEAENQVREGFLSALAGFLNTSITRLNMEKEWATSGPSPWSNLTLSTFLNHTYASLIAKDQARLVRDPFFHDYAAAHDGRRPFVNPVPLRRWTWADTQLDTIYDDAVRNKTAFMTWFNSHILPDHPDPLTCSSGLLLHIDSGGGFGDRNEYPSPPGLPFGYDNAGISIFAETPESVFPLEDIPVFSPITNHTEYLPVTIEVMAARGCDGLLSRLAIDLVEAGILSIPQSGSGLHGGAILLRRDYRE